MSEEKQSVRIEDLPQSYQIVAKLVGVENALTLGAALGGTTLYFQKLDSAISKARDRQIVAEFDGHNHKELAGKYNLTEAWIREVRAGRYTLEGKSV